MGDPACWLEVTCPECGRLVEDEQQPGTCPRCGIELDTLEVGDNEQARSSDAAASQPTVADPYP